MKILLILSILVCLVGTAMSSPCNAPTYPISGRVTAGGTGIRNARVTIARGEDGLRWSALTNSFGYYRLTIPPCGSFEASASARGYLFDYTYLFTLPVDELVEGRVFDFTATNN